MPVDLNTDETERELARGLPDHLPRGEGSGNRKLLESPKTQINDVIDNIVAAEKAVQVQRAETRAQLREIGRELGLPPLGSEGTEHYRARLLAESQLTTSKGTIRDVIYGTATVLDVLPENIFYESPAVGSTENGTASVEVPANALDNSGLTDTEVASYIDKFASVGCRIEAVARGTFTYITPSDYDSGNHDASKGYDGLDANGDPKDNGGTYAGLIG